MEEPKSVASQVWSWRTKPLFGLAEGRWRLTRAKASLSRSRAECIRYAVTAVGAREMPAPQCT